MALPDTTTEKLLDLAYDAMDAQTKRVASHIAGRKHIARNTSTDLADDTAPHPVHAQPMRWPALADRRLSFCCLGRYW